MAGVKKSIYLDMELDRALRRSAEASGRSVTKQIDFILRSVLMRPTDADETHVYFPFRPRRDMERLDVRPDPKIKPVKLRS